MPKERDDETGKYTENYPPEKFVSALKELGSEASTQEIADRVGCAYRTAHAKLSTLEDAGKITSRTVGNAKLWQLG
jgi:predicted transcriptional regulator